MIYSDNIISEQKMQAMTGYERCLSTINGNTPDLTPAYTPTISSDVAEKILGRTAHTGGPALWYAEAVAWSNGPNAWQEFDCQVKSDIIDLNKALSQEIIRFPWRKNIRPTSRINENTFISEDTDGTRRTWRWDTEVMNFIHSGIKQTPHNISWVDVARRAEQNLDKSITYVEQTAGVQEAELQEYLGESMMVVAGGGGLSLGITEEELIAAITEPEVIADILDCNLEIGMAQLEAISTRGIKVVLGGGDMADKNGPIYSPEMFAQLMLPRWKKISARCHELQLHYVWRSDGNIWKVSDMLFKDAKISGFGEVDYDATMQTEEIKKRYPELVIWGNLSGDTLRRGTVDDTYRHSMDVLECSKGNRYFHGCSNTILPGTPPDNVYAMMAARDNFTI